MKRNSRYKIITLILLVSLITVLFSGCTEDNNNQKEVTKLLIYYSTSSDKNVNFSLKLSTEDTVIFNDTIEPEPGESIYNSKADDGVYHVIVYFKNKKSEMDFKPNGQNSLSILIKNDNIELQEVTD